VKRRVTVYFEVAAHEYEGVPDTPEGTAELVASMLLHADADPPETIRIHVEAASLGERDATSIAMRRY
jgi:hypothetical protein